MCFSQKLKELAKNNRQFEAIESKILWYLRGERLNYVESSPWKRKSSNAKTGYTVTEPPDNSEQELDYNKSQKPRDWVGIDRIRAAITNENTSDDLGHKLINLASNDKLVKRKKRENRDFRDKEVWKLTELGVAVVDTYYKEINENKEIKWDPEKVKKELD